MNSSIPWQIDGVDPQARDTAQEAARRAGLSLGEWLDAVILNSARHDPTPAARTDSSRPGAFESSAAPSASPASPERAERSSAAMPSRISDDSPLDRGRPAAGDDTFIRAAELIERLTLVRAGDHYRPVVDEGFARLNDRLDRLTLKLSELVAAHAARPAATQHLDGAAPARLLDALDRRLDQLASAARSAKTDGERRSSDADVADAPATPLDQALLEIADRQRMLDGSPPAAPVAEPTGSHGSLPRARTQELSGLEQQLRQINAQIEQLKQPGSLEKAVDTLRDDLAEIGVMLQEAMPRKAIEALEAEVRRLVERIEETRQAGADGAALAGVERALADMRDSLRTLTPAENLVEVQGAVEKLAQKIDAVATSSHDPTALVQLESAIVAMRGMVTHVASNEALARLSEEVRTLAGKVDQVAGANSGNVLAALEGRIATLADALAAHNQTGHAVPPAVDVDGLIERIERAQLTRGDQAAVGHLEERIARLVEKLDASDARFPHLEAIERGMAELLIHLEQQRNPDRAGVEAARPPEVDVLSRDVADLKQSEKQTQDALEAVHGTLGHVVDRLAMIETGLRDPVRPTFPLPSGALPLQMPAQPAVAVDASQPTISPVLDHQSGTSAPSELLQAASAAADLAPALSLDAAGKPVTAASERRPIDPSLPPDHPLEPGTGVARSRTPASPADRIAASEAALAGTKPPVIPDPAGKTSFIAAARRAAQAAGREAPVKEAAATEVATAAGKLASRVGKLRALLGGTAAIVLVLGVIQIARVLLDSSAEPDTAMPGQVASSPAPAPPPSPVEAPAPTETAPASASDRQSVIPPAIDTTAVATPGPGLIAPLTPPPSALGSPKAIAPAEATGAVSRTPLSSAAPGSKPVIGPAVQPSPERPGISAGLRAAAVKGDPAAQLEMGMRLAEGRGVPQNMSEAAEWLERAAKQGVVPARFRLGGLYEKGLGVQKNLNEARRLYLAAGEAGHAKALHNLAVLYAEGIDGKPDYQIAAKWFRKAADYGVTDSQFNLAVLYARGIGVEQSLTESYKWFELAARDGDAEAAKKRDEIGARLAPQLLSAAAQALKAWKPEQQPEAAVSVRSPTGGWDAPATAGNPPHATTPSPRRKPQAQAPTLDLSPVSQTR
jgi:localization factor PodJL